jgi:hypothetical protein
MKTKLLLFLLLSISLFSNTPDLFNNLNLEENNKEPLLSVPSSNTKSSTAKNSELLYNFDSLESQFKLNENPKTKYKSYWQNIEDLIFLSKFLNKSVNYHPKIGEITFFSFVFVINR